MTNESEEAAIDGSSYHLEKHPSNLGIAIPNDIKQLLYTLPFFTGFANSNSLIDDVSKVLHMRKYATGDIVIHQGAPAKAMFFIIKGSLKVISDDGEIELAELSNGTYCNNL